MTAPAAAPTADCVHKATCRLQDFENVSVVVLLTHHKTSDQTVCADYMIIPLGGIQWKT